MLPIECGLFGICGQKLVGNNHQLITDALSKLQHRGQDSYGYSYYEPQSKSITVNHLMGLVNHLEIDERVNKISELSLTGHLRYKTSGKKGADELNIQPFMSKYGYTICHNGNIKETELLHKMLLSLNPNLLEEEMNELVERQHDTYYLLKILENLSAEELEDKLVQLLNLVSGVYCLLILKDNTIYIVRDKYGVRPLSLATIEINGETQYMVASESFAFPDNSYLVRDVNPGEVIKMNIDVGFDTIYQMKTPSPAHCLFEYIYFLKPETKADGLLASDVRCQYGELLAKKEIEEHQKIGKLIENISLPFVDEPRNVCIIRPIDYSNKDYIVVGSPSSGVLAAEKYANVMGLKYEQVIIKQKNIRSFILNNDADRRKACYMKFRFIEENIIGKKIILVDDSLVRGNTVRIMAQVLKELGAVEVHIRIASPPIKYPCYFGIDIPTKKELIATQHSLYSVTRIIGADSLIYLDLEEVRHVHKNTLCHACFSGNYQKELLEW
jgi:amidophosphoribosyltransferase